MASTSAKDTADTTTTSTSSTGTSETTGTSADTSVTTKGTSATTTTAEHSKNFEKVRKYYRDKRPDGRRMWTKAMVKNAVGKWITEDEYYEITGEKYSA